MPTVDNSGKPAYMYEQSTDTWHAINGRVSTAANYVWIGTHQFNNNISIAGTLNAVKKFNSFLNPAARSAVITAPEIGLITFIQQDSLGTTVNRFEYWNGSSWTTIFDVNAAETFTNKTMNGASNSFINIPLSAVPNAAPLYVTIDSKTSSYSLVLSDSGKQIEMNVAAPNNITIPTNNSVPFPIGTVILVVQSGTGQTTIVGDSGVTVNATPGLKLRTQWSVATLTKRATNTWLAAGDLIA